MLMQNVKVNDGENIQQAQLKSKKKTQNKQTKKINRKTKTPKDLCLARLLQQCFYSAEIIIFSHSHCRANNNIIVSKYCRQYSHTSSPVCTPHTEYIKYWTATCSRAEYQLCKKVRPEILFNICWCNRNAYPWLPIQCPPKHTNRLIITICYNCRQS